MLLLKSDIIQLISNQSAVLVCIIDINQDKNVPPLLSGLYAVEEPTERWDESTAIVPC